VAKTGPSSAGNLKKTLNFGEGGSGMEVHVLGDDFENLEAIVEQTSIEGGISTQEGILNVIFHSENFHG